MTTLALSPWPVVLLLGALYLAPASAQAQPTAGKPAAAAAAVSPDGPTWRSLTAEQRQNLAPLERDWPGIETEGKAKWLEVSSRFATMPADERRRVQARMADWARLTPAERGQARLSFQEKKALTSEQKQQRWEAYQALPDDHRQALTAKAVPADERRRAASASGGDAARQRPATPAAAASRPQLKPVAPSIVQARPGATTTLITKKPQPPAHQPPGQPGIAAKPGQIDDKTLLPRSGPQAAASPPRKP